ncbi:MAG: TetR family transcriptional regulator C-terminal domain-containing protein [Paracoccaceae bacterium]
MSSTDPNPRKPRKERKDNADKRRQQLLDATLRSIVSNGLTKTTLATVANEAGLSQGVAVFYFNSKTGLLTETLRDHYQTYEDNWQSMLEKAGPDPLERLMAMIRADFSPKICSPEALSVWFAFWGEQKFTPQYAEISAQFDQNRTTAIREICRELVRDTPKGRADMVADWIDTYTDGYWQKLHLFPGAENRENAIAATFALIAELMPEHATRLPLAGRATA